MYLAYDRAIEIAGWLDLPSPPHSEGIIEVMLDRQLAKIKASILAFAVGSAMASFAFIAWPTNQT